MDTKDLQPGDEIFAQYLGGSPWAEGQTKISVADGTDSLVPGLHLAMMGCFPGFASVCMYVSWIA